jgi:AmmeMemoRadiSam system protein B
MSERRVRPPVCADDRWMPSRTTELSALLDQLLANAKVPPIEGELIGLIAPHAGYAFSGQTAAYSYKQAVRRDVSRVVLLGPSHFADLGPQAMNSSGLYSTPLGQVETDTDAVSELSHRVGFNFVTSDQEHSLEMQLPFLQKTLKTFKLVPIMLSHPFYIVGIRARNVCEDLSAALSQVIDDKTLMVASSDLSHLHDYDAVTYFDQGFENLISEFNIGGLVDYMINEGECRACGDVGIITMLMAAKARGANRVAVLHRTNSGDVTGIRTSGQYTVGYMAAAVYRHR